MSVCGGWSLVTLKRGYTNAITLWCRAWSCPDCNPRRLRQLKHLAASGHPTTFLTLTVNPAHGQSVNERARELSDALKIMVKRARRKFRKAAIEYIAIFEETKRGEPHLHLLARAPFIPQRWLSATMQELIEAPIVDIRKVHSARHVAFYVAKYIAKGPKPFGSLKRYWATPGYQVDRREHAASDDETGSRWFIVQQPLWMLAERFAILGWPVEWISPTEWAHVPDSRARAGPYCNPLASYDR